MSILRKISKLGVNRVDEVHLKKRIIMANTIGLVLIFCLALPMHILALIFFPPVAYLPIVGIVLAGLAIFVFNRYGFHVLGRAVVGLVPVVVSIGVGAGIMDAEKSVILSSYLIQFSLVFVPCLVFDVKKELLWFVIINIISITLVANFDFFNAFYETGIDDSVLRDGWLGNLFAFFGYIMGLANFMVLILINKRSEDEVSVYFNEAKERTREFQKSSDLLSSKLGELGAERERDELAAWFALGLAGAGDVLRENKKDLVDLSTNLVTFLVEYLKASHATLYTLAKNQSGEDAMELKASHGLAQLDLTKRQFTKEDYLVGQCWKDGSYINVSGIPSTYVGDNSDTEVSPKNLILLPFKDHSTRKIEAILELAKIEEITANEIEILQKIGESAALAINTIRTEALTTVLLEEAQEMSVSLREQEEELRQNAEEMMATQEELQLQLDRTNKEKQSLQEKIKQKEK